MSVWLPVEGDALLDAFRRFDAEEHAEPPP